MNKHVRAVGIVIYNNQLLVLWRKNTKEYFVFPGGGKEDNETIEEAVARELLEETSIQIKILKLLYHISYDDTTEHYFYLCDYVSGEPILGNFNEMASMQKGNNLYKPMWIALAKLPRALLYPLEIRDLLLADIRKNFTNTPKELQYKVSERSEE